MKVVDIAVLFLIMSCGDNINPQNKSIDYSAKIYKINSQNNNLFKLAFCDQDKFSLDKIISFSAIEKTKSIMICGNLDTKTKIWTCCDKHNIDLSASPYGKDCFIANSGKLFSGTNILLSNCDKISLGKLNEE